TATVTNDSFTVKATDSNNSSLTATQALTITVGAGVTVTTASLPNGYTNTAYSQALVASGGSGSYTWSISSGSLPVGLTLSGNTISGTPTTAGGPFSFTVKATDSNNSSLTATQALSITVGVGVTITTTSLPGGYTNTAYSQTLAASGGSGSYTWSLFGGSLPAGLTLSGNTISGTPSTAGGPFSFTVQATDSNNSALTATQALSITVGVGVTITTASLPNGYTSTAYLQTLAASGGSGSYTWSLFGGSLPAGLTLSGSTISGTPTAAGTTNFTVKATDSNNSSLTATQNLSIKINTLFSITSTSMPAGTAGVAYSFTPQTTGGVSPLTWSVTGLPTRNSTLTYNSSTGAITGAVSVAGSYTLTFSVSDSSTPTQYASAILTLVISPATLAFTTTSPLPVATLNAAYSQQIGLTGGTAPYTWTVGSGLPAGLILDTTGLMGCGGQGIICGTPTALVTNASFTVTVKDSGSPAQQISQAFALSVTTTGVLGTITVPSVGVGQDLEVPITVTLSPAPTSPVTVTLTSGDSSSVIFGSLSQAVSGQIQASLVSGQTSFGTYVQALAASGTITITATAPGYSNGVGTVTLANSGFVVSGPNGVGGSFTTYQGTPTTLTVYAARLDGSGFFVESESVAGGMSFTVPIAGSGAGTVAPVSLAFGSGVSSATATFTASSSTTGSASVNVTQPSPFTTPTVGGSLGVTVQASGLVAPSNVTIGNNLEVPLNVTLSGPAPSGITVTLTSQNPSSLLFSNTAGGTGQTSINITINQNQTSSTTFYAQGFGSPGSAGYTIYASAYGTTNATVSVGASGFVIQTPNGYGQNFSTGLSAPASINVYTALVDSNGALIATQAVAGGVSVTATVTSDTPSVGTISPASVQIANGGQYGTTYLQPVAAGNCTITASATGYGSASVTATVTGNKFNIAFNGATVGQYLENQNLMILNTAAPAGGLPVTLTSSDSSKLLLAVNPTDPGSTSITVTVSAGTYVAYYYVYALASSSWATYSGEAPNYASTGNDTVYFAPSGIVIYGPNGATNSFSASVSAGNSGTQYPCSIYTEQLSTDGSNTPQYAQALAGNTALNVALTNSNSTFGTVPTPVSIAPGATGATVLFTPLSAGSTTISVTQPWNLPNAYTSIMANVAN
ncbi:MAG: beta strand repeat-containing protein, partial [Bryobacteraceae bacterium]